MRYKAEEIDILKRFFTSVDSPVFGLINLPEVVKGTMFSRYSRTSKDLRRLFLDEFFSNKDIAVIFDTTTLNEVVDVQRAEDFYERVLVGYGDDSVAELGGAHVAIEEISMLATKSIEEHRLGLSPLEKSTRYVYYDNKVEGEYLYYRDPVIMDSEYAELYIRTNEMLFETYSKIVREIQPLLQKIYPAEGEDKAYKASIRAKACDIARSLLPLSALTNMGVMGNGRALEYMLTTLIADPLTEVRNVAQQLDSVLKQVVPAFVKRATNERGDATREYLRQTIQPFQELRSNYIVPEKKYNEPVVRLVDYDPLAIEKIIAAILYTYTDLEYAEALDEAKHLSEEEKETVIQQLGKYRKNRHHKPLRFVEEPYFAFEVIADWGVYKDLMRHRVLTRHKKQFTSNLGYYVPYEIEMTGFSDLFTHAMDKASEAYNTIKNEFPYESQYLVTHGSFTNFYQRINLRALTHMIELRSTPQGHPAYRKVAQDMARLVSKKFPIFGQFIFGFVDYKDYELERLEAFRKIEKKASAIGVKVFEE